jgi:hypothetical protein
VLPIPDQKLNPRNAAGRKGKESIDKMENINRLNNDKDNTNPSPSKLGGTSSAYRIAKLKRDHPDIAASNPQNRKTQI